MEMNVVQYIGGRPLVNGVLIDGVVRNKRLKSISLTRFGTDGFELVRVVTFTFDESEHQAGAQLYSALSSDMELCSLFGPTSVYFVLQADMIKLLQDSLPQIQSFVLLSSVIDSPTLDSIYSIPIDLHVNTITRRLRNIACHLMETLMDDRSNWVNHELVKNLVNIEETRLHINRLHHETQVLISKLVKVPFECLSSYQIVNNLSI